MSTTGKDGSEDFSAGDRITLVFDDAPGEQITATVHRKLSDIEEGCSTEVEQYVDYWLEIHCEGEEYAASARAGGPPVVSLGPPLTCGCPIRTRSGRVGT